MKKSYTISLLIIELLFFVKLAQAQTFADSESFASVQAKEDVSIYPNPVKEQYFFVKTSQTIESLEVINILGQPVNINADRQNFGSYRAVKVRFPYVTKGVYLVRIKLREQDKILIRKILVE